MNKLKKHFGWLILASSGEDTIFPKLLKTFFFYVDQRIQSIKTFTLHLFLYISDHSWAPAYYQRQNQLCRKTSWNISSTVQVCNIVKPNGTATLESRNEPMVKCRLMNAVNQEALNQAEIKLADGNKFFQKIQHKCKVKQNLNLFKTEKKRTNVSTASKRIKHIDY